MPKPTPRCCCSRNCRGVGETYPLSVFVRSAFHSVVLNEAVVVDVRVVCSMVSVVRISVRTPLLYRRHTVGNSGRRRDNWLGAGHPHDSRPRNQDISRKPLARALGTEEKAAMLRAVSVVPRNGFSRANHHTTEPARHAESPGLVRVNLMKSRSSNA